ncbi:MAG: NADH-quinone oxidoreductase subunit F, partial [Betaproteobacteria bacterium]|nr:NADH-quinone oxidoreductase subunit F [Betaproteobacteria bacterium]
MTCLHGRHIQPLLFAGLNGANWRLADYVSRGGYAVFQRILKEGISQDEIIAEMTASSLRGRGGAAFPTGVKWGFMPRNYEGQKYLICNADESEPGTFKDRLIMDKLPLKLLEGITIAGFTFQAKAGYIYVRGEYRNIQKRLLAAIENAKAARFLGTNILGTGFDFDIHIISGAGAYVCGENSALLNSTEGKVGRPRIKPPHLAEVGLFLQPTLVNNVESLANIPAIVNMGGDNYLQIGHPDSGGTKLICLSGHVQNKGVFEVPLGGVTLR